MSSRKTVPPELEHIQYRDLWDSEREYLLVRAELAEALAEIERLEGLLADREAA